MKLIMDGAVLETLLERAAMASRLVGHIDERSATSVIDPLADSIDEMVHVLSELLGSARVVATASDAGPTDSAASVNQGHHPSQGARLALIGSGEAL